MSKYSSYSLRMVGSDWQPMDWDPDLQKRSRLLLMIPSTGRSSCGLLADSPRMEHSASTPVDSVESMATEQHSTRVQHLIRLADLRREREATLYAFARAEFAAVLDARLEGATWAEVGRALGVSAQAVQQKFHGRMIPTGAEPAARPRTRRLG